MAKDDDSGLMSSAGLVRYFDADESVWMLDPKTIMLFGILFSTVIGVVNLLI